MTTSSSLYLDLPDVYKRASGALFNKQSSHSELPVQHIYNPKSKSCSKVITQECGLGWRDGQHITNVAIIHRRHNPITHVRDVTTA